MTHYVQLFENDEIGAVITVVENDGEPWFVAKEIAEVLEYATTEKMLRHLDDNDKEEDFLFFHPGYGDEVTGTIISEPGVYAAVFFNNNFGSGPTSDAKKFTRWITREVLPEARSIINDNYTGVEEKTIEAEVGNFCAKEHGELFPLVEMVALADEFLGGRVALTALHYFTGMPVDDLLDEIVDMEEEM